MKKGGAVMPKCVVFSERAFTSILVETQEKIRTETGGVFLGYRKGDVWYVIESIDPVIKMKNGQMNCLKK